MAGVQFSGVTVPTVLVLLNRELVETFYKGGGGVVRVLAFRDVVIFNCKIYNSNIY